MVFKKYTIEFFKKFAQDKKGECLSDRYVNVRTKLRFKCSEGHEWEAQPRKILEDSWCPQCARERIRKYPVDDQLFSTDTEKSFYLAGFWAADGWITRASGAYTIGLTLAAKDVSHLRKIREAFGCDIPLRFRKGSSPNSDTVTFSYTLAMSSEQIFNDLARFNVVERKTYIYSMPDWLIDHPLLHHFLRGYIDGDGCIGIAKNKNQDPHVNFSMRGTAVFLNQFQNILIKEKIVSPDNRRKLEPKVGAKGPTFDKIQVNGNGSVSRLYDFLYRNYTICLDRKQELGAKAKEWAVYSEGKRRRRKKTAIPMTKEILLEKAAEYKSQKLIAEHFKCTPAAISWWVKELGIKEEMRLAMGKKR